jgi:hypothetical protein
LKGFDRGIADFWKTSMITIEGTVQRSTLGTGTWAFVTREGVTYELMKGTPKELLQSGAAAKVTGQVREDVMSIAMIGAILEVKSFDLL